MSDLSRTESHQTLVGLITIMLFVCKSDVLFIGLNAHNCRRIIMALSADALDFRLAKMRYIEMDSCDSHRPNASLEGAKYTRS